MREGVDWLDEVGSWPRFPPHGLAQDTCHPIWTDSSTASVSLLSCACMQKVRFENSPSRCPYCHDSVPTRGAVVCQECLARHHAACWIEQGECSACACSEKLVSEQVMRAKTGSRPLRFKARSTSSSDFLGLNQQGLIVFIVLLLVCIPLCWIPWLMPSMRANST